MVEIMFDIDEYERWMKQAEYTLESAKRDLLGGDYSWASFKAQQAAEFSVKALLYGLGIAAFGHSIGSLLRELKNKGIQIDTDIEVCSRELDRHYIPTRYANAFYSGSPFEYYDEPTAKKAIDCATKIIKFIKSEAREWI